MSNKNIPIGDKFREVRRSMHLTQEEFANKLDIGQSYYSSIETGKKQPTTQLIDKLISLGVSPLWIFEGVGNDIDNSNHAGNNSLLCIFKEQLKMYFNGLDLQPTDYEYNQIKIYEQFDTSCITKLIYNACNELEQVYNSYIKLTETIHFFGNPKFLLEKFKKTPPYTDMIQQITEEHEEDMKDIGIKENKLSQILFLLNIKSSREHWIRAIEQCVDYIYMYKKMIVDDIKSPEFSVE